MRTQNLILTIILIVFFISTQSRGQDWETIAKKIVNNTARVQPGDIVIIQGGKHTLPLMEQISAEIYRVGGRNRMIVNSDVAIYSYWHEMPEEYLGQYDPFMVEWYKQADILITLPESEEFRKIFKEVDNERIESANKNNDKWIEDISSKTNYSTVSVGFPTFQMSDNTGVNFEKIKDMHWAAVSYSPNKILDSGTKILSLLKSAKQVKVTTKEGTSLTFNLKDRLAFVDEGILSDDEKSSDIWFQRYASLPGGFIDFAPSEASVNGKVVISQSRCRYDPLRDISFKVENGIMKNFKAGEGEECFLNNIAGANDDVNKVSVITIGLNPEFKIIQDGKKDFRRNIAAGFMTINFGGNNSQYNGSVNSTRSTSFPLVNPTLEIDGNVVIKEGKIL